MLNLLTDKAMRLTKKQMVKDIFFLATNGQRTADNFVRGMGIIDAVADHNYRTTIQEAWDEVNEAGDRITARRVMHFLGNATSENLCTASGFPGPRVWSFRDDMRKFGF